MLQYRNLLPILFDNRWTCDSDDLECYVVDNNGFVVISEDPVHTGMLFGDYELFLGYFLNILGQFLSDL